MPKSGRRRLTSWKEIATHVGRDVRTVLRWEKDRGLPVHRVPGVTGRVVFAYTDELDAWAQSGPPKTEEPPDDSAVAPAVPGPSRWRLSPAATALVVTTLAVVAWRVGASKGSGPPLTFRFTETAIIAMSSDGVERWRYAFPPGETAPSVRGEQDHAAEVIGGTDIITAIGYTIRSSDSIVRSGELLRFSMNGELKNTFTFEDRPHFGGGLYGAPWSITDYRVEGSKGADKVALAAHHYEWWPSLVTVLDRNWNRGGTFVNAGWVEHLHWVAPDRLAIAGFSNARDGAMIALLDTNAMDGQSPAPAGSQFECTSCGPGKPLRYIVMPRTEVNRASISPFNRVVLSVKRDRLVARTIEIPMNSAEAAVDALYEFTPSLDLIRASYSDHYWNAHRDLELQGRITHTREHCPDRDGPRQIFVWEPATGWVTRAIGQRPITDVTQDR
jgi:hypothetical protein